MIIYYTVPEIWCVTDVVFVFHFGLFFAYLMQYVLQRCNVNMWKGRAFLKENIEKKYFVHKINFEFAL